jgi:protocatechuate 3,4-dioxygenase beta subunit
MAGWVWFVGSLASFLRLLYSNREVVRLKRMAGTEPGPETSVEVEALKRALSVTAPVDVRIGPHDMSPMTCGLLRQMILMPPASALWTAQRRRLVLAHELAHAKRRDGLTQTIAGIVCALYWFHPAAWLAARRMGLERERACDDVVLSLGVDAGDYVEQLLGIAREINSKYSPAAVAMAHPWQLEARLRAILDPGARRRTLSRPQMALLLVSVVLAAGAASGIELNAVAQVQPFGLQRDPVSSQGTARLEGTVTDAQTGRPIAGAEVRLVTGVSAFPERNVPVGWPQRTFPKPPYSATTDTSGRFTIEGVRPGPYRVGASAEGYANHELGQRSPDRPVGVRVDVTADSPQPLTLQLTRAATLGGRVSGELRQPLQDVPVYLLQQLFDANGNGKLVANATTATSEAGAYAFTDVPPGRYYLVAGRGASLINSRRSQPLYGWTFYPGTTDASLALGIDALPGAALHGLDLSLSLQQSRQIKGTVIDSRTGKPPEKASVFLNIMPPFGPGDGGGTLPYDPATGAFEATGLVDGVYAIGVDLEPSQGDRIFLSHPRHAWEQFAISGSDAGGIVVRAPRSGYIQGRIALGENRALPEAYRAPSSAGQPPGPTRPGPRIALEPTANGQPRPINGPVESSDGTFEVPTALIGTYRLHVLDLPAGYYVKSVRLNGALAPDLLLDFHPEERTQLDITIASGAGELRGVVVDGRQEPLAGASGLLLPDPLPARIGYFRTFVADQKGAFALSGIRPGRYRVHVFDGLVSGEFPEPGLLRSSAALATPVVVTEGSELSITTGAVRMGR